MYPPRGKVIIMSLRYGCGDHGPSEARGCCLERRGEAARFVFERAVRAEGEDESEYLGARTRRLMIRNSILTKA